MQATSLNFVIPITLQPDGENLFYLTEFIVVEIKDLKIRVCCKNTIHLLMYAMHVPRPVLGPELKTLEWWISRLMRDPLFFIISRLILSCTCTLKSVYKIQSIRVAYMKPTNLKFCAPFKIIYRNGRHSLIWKNRFLIFQ